MAKNEKVTEKKKEEFKLPRYLRLNKGSMWLDDQDENSSGTRIFAMPKVFVGKETKLESYMVAGEQKYRVIPSDVPKDEFNNKNLVNFGTVDSDLPWYFETTNIPKHKLSRVIMAYKNEILVEADPNNIPKPKVEGKVGTGDFKIKENGDRVFIGKNAEIFNKLQNNTFAKLRDFINTTPKTEIGRLNLIDMYNYERAGHNPLSRPRFEVLELIRTKLAEFGNGLSGIRVNED